VKYPWEFGLSLLSAFKNPWSPDIAKLYIQEGRDHRINGFLSLCDSRIFANDKSPYRKLLDHAGFTKEKLINDVMRHGLENTLLRMAVEGVYLDVEEFKGKKPVIRPGLRINVDASVLDIANEPSIQLKSSGSRGPGMKTRIGIEGLNLLSSYIPLMLKFLNAEALPIVLYYPMPSVSGIIHLIIYTMAGKPPSAWFTQMKAAPLSQSKTGFKLLALKVCSKLSGIDLPSPQYSDIHRPVTLAKYLKEECPKGAIISTFTGAALHLVQTAQKENIKLPQLVFILGGEPITERKRHSLEFAGHKVFPWYSSVETGRIALGCLSPHHADEMHLLTDRMAAVIRPCPANAKEMQRRSLLLTSIHPDMYKFLLNVETGDEAVFCDTPCGCPWEALGFTQRLHSIRSFEKLTLEGMSIVADNLMDFVEEELPARCGGTPLDYQFTEEEDADGLTRLVLSVSPSVPMALDQIQKIVKDLFYELPSTFFAATYLNQASSFLVRREYPKLTQSGKILTLRSIKKKAFE
jgi:hypothetical protein